ncbi:MAG: L-seryl-tRNA(Sec) selenium transferase [Turicibacter sp.]|nr:L-seryl-tRNA(Sec) selenium transferase [Turicibacter sp.]
MDKQLFTSIPSVNALLQSEAGLALIARFSHASVVEAFRVAIDRLRQGAFSVAHVDDLAAALTGEAQVFLVEKFAPSLTRCINATGTVIHTNLGRSKLSPIVLEELTNAAFANTNLEYNLASGGRGSRYQHLEAVLCELTGSEAALVVNNNAAAVMLVLDTVAKAREVVVSRGELVEIGGSFRIPDIVERSGCCLKEVGTTNKTHPDDYARALGDQSAAILKVHTSNYKISGFTKEVDVAELAAIARENNVPLIHDMGSGMLIDLQKFGLPYEMTVQDSLASGADIVTFSGDKVLGGPQAGIIVGKKTYIEAMKKNQLTRALRVDKMTIAALEATLRLYYDEALVLAEIPTLAMLTASLAALELRADQLIKTLAPISSASVEIVDTQSQVGGGAYPGEEIASKAVAISIAGLSANELAEALRRASVPIICKIRHNRCELDVRTIEADEFDVIAEALREILG